MPIHVSEHHSTCLVSYVLKLELREMPRVIGITLYVSAQHFNAPCTRACGPIRYVLIDNCTE